MVVTTVMSKSSPTDGLFDPSSAIYPPSQTCWTRTPRLADHTRAGAVTLIGFWLPSTVASNGADESSIERQKALYIIFVVTYGIFASPYISLFPTTLAEQFGPQHFGSINGFLYMLRGVGTLVGTPVAGALIGPKFHLESMSARSYERCSVFLGTLMAATAVCVCWARLESKHRS